MTNQTHADTIYVEVTGTTCYIAGERGTVKALHYGHGHANPATAAFVALDDRPAMLLVALGARVGERRTWAEIDGAREIDRDEFDRLTGLADIRRSMGWTL